MPQRNTNQPTEPLIDTQSGLVLGIERERSFGARCLGPLLSDQARNRDIAGDGILEVMTRTGWHFQDRPVLATARDPSSGVVVAAAWCTPIRWLHSAARVGLNLSYATSEQWTGRGLPGLLSSLAFNHLKHELSADHQWDLNIQCDEQNLSSQKAAQRMPFTRAPDADFAVPSLERRYVTFSCPHQTFADYAQQLLESRTECQEINDVVYIKQRR